MRESSFSTRPFAPRLFWALLFVVLLANCSTDTSQPPQPECGIERWHVKNLIDPAADSIETTPTPMSIAEIDTFTQVSVNVSTPRLAFEKKLVSVSCTIVGFKREEDEDVHVLMTDMSGDTIIGEIPSTSCPEVAGSLHANDFDNALAWVKANLGNPTTSFKPASVSVTVTGVLFQDFSHGQKGEAKNSMEIHPVLKFE